MNVLYKVITVLIYNYSLPSGDENHIVLTGFKLVEDHRLLATSLKKVNILK